MLQLNSDNMKNNGFTLVELIITITLIAIISVSIGVSISGMLSREKESQAEEYDKTIADAACVYAELNDITYTTDEVTIQDLLDAGLITKDLTNPLSDKEITEYASDKVLISWDNGLKTCSYNNPESTESN